MKKTKRIPTVIAVLIMSLGLGLGVVLIQYRSFFRLRANPDSGPRDIKITNISDSSFTVSWTTDSQILGAVNWGETTALGKIALEPNQLSGDVHYITVNDLVAATTYYFKLRAGVEEFDNSGIPWQITTSQKITPTNASLISGTILTPGGQPASNVIVSLTANGVLFSALTSANGSWLISLSSIDIPKNMLLQIFVNGGALGKSSAQIYLNNATVAPSIVLGKTYDFRNLEKNNPNLPAVNLQVPTIPTP